MLMNDVWIAEKSYKNVRDEIRHSNIPKSFLENMALIYPFAYHTNQDKEGNKLISYGLSSFGYDVRLAPEFKLVQNSTDVDNTPWYLDPKEHDESKWISVKANTFIIPAHGFVLGTTIERLNIPRNVSCLVIGKSTYARLGIIVNATPLEAGWSGQITLELSNTTNVPVKIYANEGIAQVLFFEGDSPEVSYRDRKGKYQNQVGIVHSKV